MRQLELDRKFTFDEYSLVCNVFRSEGFEISHLADRSSNIYKRGYGNVGLINKKSIDSYGSVEALKSEDHSKAFFRALYSLNDHFAYVKEWDDFLRKLEVIQ